jgi:hypothetical protein
VAHQIIPVVPGHSPLWMNPETTKVARMIYMFFQSVKNSVHAMVPAVRPRSAESNH